jgi:hypothetical protein
MTRHYAAYLRVWLHITQETSVNGNQAELCLCFGTKIFTAVFGCRKKTWSLSSIEIRRGEQIATLTRGELSRRWLPYSGKSHDTRTQSVKANLRPRTDATLHEHRTTMIRTCGRAGTRRTAAPGMDTPHMPAYDPQA